MMEIIPLTNRQHHNHLTLTQIMSLIMTVEIIFLTNRQHQKTQVYICAMLVLFSTLLYNLLSHNI